MLAWLFYGTAGDVSVQVYVPSSEYHQPGAETAFSVYVGANEKLWFRWNFQKHLVKSGPKLFMLYLYSLFKPSPSSAVAFNADEKSFPIR